MFTKAQHQQENHVVDQKWWAQATHTLNPAQYIAALIVSYQNKSEYNHNAAAMNNSNN